MADKDVNRLKEFYQDKVILVTGGTGFVGQHLVSKLKSMGAKVFVTAKNVKQTDIDEKGGSIHLDITNFTQVRNIFREINPHIIFHLAAIVTASRNFDDIDLMIDVNLRGTTNVFRAIEGLPDLQCVINFGSSEEYGDQKGRLSEALRESPCSPYAVLKMATSRFSNMFAACLNIPIITIRPANLFGTGQEKGKFIPFVIINSLKNQPIQMTFGEQKRNFIFVDDFVEAILLIAQKERNFSQIYNIGYNRPYRLKDIVEKIKRMTKSTSVIHYGAIDYRKDEMMEFNLSISKIKSLGWKPSHTFEQAIKKTIDYYRNTSEGNV